MRQPLKDAMLLTPLIIRGADDRISETIKWSARPTTTAAKS